MVREALRRGHEVELFHRGSTAAPELANARHRLGDRTQDLSALKDNAWDVVIDTCAYKPFEVHLLADALQGRCSQYVLVSTISVYASDIAPGSDESAPRKSTASLDMAHERDLAITPDTYGALKVLCEDVARTRFGHTLIVRPSYVIGPEDYTQRFPEWVRRIAAGGEVLLPEPQDAAMQYVDARDLANFVLDGVQRQLQGVFHIAAPALQFGFGQMIETMADVAAPASYVPRWISAQAALQAQANGQSFPLWAQGESAPVLAVNPAAAVAEGLVCRPLEHTVRDVLAWIDSA